MAKSWSSRAIAAVALVGGALAASPAAAGEYVVDQCSERTTGAPRSVVSEWSAAGPARKYVECGAYAGSFGLELPQAGTLRYGTTAWLRLAAPASPASVEVARASLAYRVRPHTGNYAFLEVFSLGTRQYSERLPSDRTHSPLELAFPSGTRSFDVGIYCSTGHGAVDCNWGSAFEVLRVTSARLTLREDVAPALSVDGGSLLQPGARSGSETLAYSASDDAAGVERVAVRIGGVVAGERDLRGDPVACPRDSWSACARQRAEELAVDTTRVADGTHRLSVVATDAAGNRRIAEAGTVIVRNRPPDAPAAPSDASAPGARGAPNGDPATDGARLTAVFEASGSASAQVRHGRSATVAGQLVDERGRPIAGALLDVSSVLATRGAEARSEGAARTDASGRFRHPLAADASRTVVVSYRARERDAQPAARADLALHVAAPVSLRARPARLRNRRVVSLSGRVAGRPMPTRGVVVDLQVRLAARWRSFAVVRTTRTGRYRHRHRFRHVTRHPARFRFRARVRRDAAYPFTSGRSRVVAVVVRP